MVERLRTLWSSLLTHPLPMVERLRTLLVERAYASLPHFDWVEQARNSLALPEQSEKIRVRSEKPTHPLYGRVRIAFGRSTKGTESLTIHMVRDFSLDHKDA